MTEDFVRAGQPPGWYQHPAQDVDFFWTGRAFAVVDGVHVRRPHMAGTPQYQQATPAEVAVWVRQHGVDSTVQQGPDVEPPLAIRREFIVTLDHVPGHQIVRVIGVVFQLATSFTWTAEAKGNEALAKALRELSSQAARAGANAVVGLHAATYAARGGVTSGLGGDAVGVLLTGTAVVVAAE